MNTHLMMSRAAQARAERAALAALQAVADDPKSSPAARVAAARAILERLHPAEPKAAPASPKPGKPPARTPAELEQALRLVHARKSGNEVVTKGVGFASSEGSAAGSTD